MAFSGSIDINDGLRPRNNGSFPLVKAHDVYVDDSNRLDAKLEGIEADVDQIITEEVATIKNALGGPDFPQIDADKVKVDSENMLDDVLAEVNTKIDDVLNKSVRVDKAQEFTAEQKAQALTNVGGASESEVNDLKSDLNNLATVGGSYQAVTIVPSQNYFTDQFAYYTEVDGYTKYNGRIQESSKKAYLYLPVSKGDTLLVTTGADAGTSPVLWYSSFPLEQASFISAATLPSSRITYTDEEFVAPSGALYACINTNNYTLNPISCKTFMTTRIRRIMDAGYISAKEAKTIISESRLGIYRKEINYTGTAGTATIDVPLNKGETYYLLLRRKISTPTNTLANRTVEYFVHTDEADISLGTSYSYVPKLITVQNDGIGLKIQYPAGLLWGESDTLEFVAYKTDFGEKRKTIISVDISGNGDFTNLRDALNSITDNDVINQYELQIYPGTYNILSDYTEEINESSFFGPFIGDGMFLHGIGAKGSIVLNGVLDTAQYDNNTRNRISTLNMAGECGLENLIINATNIRYAVHDDTGSMPYQPNTHTFKSCEMRGFNLTSGGNYGAIAYGAGTANLKRIIMEDCTFNDILLIHTGNSATFSATTILKNCIAKVLTIPDYNSEIHTFFNLYNCKFGLINNTVVGAPHDQFAIIDGVSSDDTLIYAEQPIAYGSSDVIRFSETIERGYAVKIDRFFKPSIATNLTDIRGISLGVINGNAYVQTKGYIDAVVLGISSMNLGDYITIDNTGAVTTGGTAENNIGQAKIITGVDNHCFIKLNIM